METVLLVEDEDAVRTLVARVLHDAGYTVIEATNGEEALRIAQARQPAVIHLLLTDMVMPQMSGKATAEQVTALYPSIKVLFMSGYTGHASLRDHQLSAGSRLIQKPFALAELLQAVREALDEVPVR